MWPDRSRLSKPKPRCSSICSKLRRALTGLRLNFVADRRRRRATRRGCLVIAGDQFAKKAPRDAGLFLFQPPRARADGVSVDPLGSCAMGSSVFPEMFLGMVAIGPD